MLKGRTARSLARQGRVEVEMVKWQVLKKVPLKGGRGPAVTPNTDAEETPWCGLHSPVTFWTSKHSVATKYGLSLLESGHNGLIKKGIPREVAI